MPNPFDTYKQFYFKQFNISTHFCSIWPIDKSLSVDLEAMAMNGHTTFPLALLERHH